VVGHGPIGILVHLRHNSLQRERGASSDRHPEASNSTSTAPKFQHVTSPTLTQGPDQIGVSGETLNDDRSGAFESGGPLPLTSSISNFLLTVAPVGMWAKASISPLSELAREVGEAQPVGNADRPHIHRPSW
jgi:hypothetical protein